ncbi:hypothetical protein EPA93_43970 [Ktedonosporobacter rubrisoli]|uniref:Uncharacterized protein n=1 Tax=Ktedonosporobacter rubrisoli TaxID=2509675 RepID=A0A4V0Z0A7_KTERU|nr:serine/threonine protein kinase [Ktedonosporobacter rubrisoli]QBD82561.1 hypothetical protein EPA93_43970 [Ktedonosporobacter rubrisoli]
MAKIFSAGDFATSGEKQVAQELEKLPNQWVVICNKTLATNNGRTFEIDFIVIGNHWIFLLDEKSWRGRIRGDEMQWVRHDGSAERSPLRKVDIVAKIMAGHLRSHIIDLSKVEEHYVRGGVVFSALTQMPPIKDRLARENIFLLPQLCESLQKLDQQGGSALVRQNRHLIQKNLYDLSNRPDIPQQVNESYQIEEAIQLRPGVRLWRATFIETQEPRHLLVYDLGQNSLHREELRQFYLREYKALNALHSTGLVPDMNDHFLWSEDFLILPIKPLPGKAISAFVMPRTRDELIKDLQIATEAFKGLATIHQHDIIHRAISPEALHLVTEHNKTRVAFTNFYAARINTHGHSIASSLDALTIDDPYAAPEIAYGYEFAQPTSDVFSLGLIFLERWSQVSMEELRTEPDKPAQIQDLQAHWSTLPPEIIQELTECLQAICGTEQYEERPRASEVAQTLRDLSKRLKIEASIQEKKRLDNRYIVHSILGQGSTARTYLAFDEISDEWFALKQFLNPSSAAAEQAKNEFKALCKLQHPNLPRIYEISPLTNDVHIKMSRIPGPTLQEVEQELPWSIDKWWNFALGLMSAVEELEKHNILHRDIKPSNIILHEDDQRPVLIDFGFAIPTNVEKSLAGTLHYLPPEAFTSSRPPASSDRYATAVVLFKTLTGQLPFKETSHGYERSLGIPTDVTNPIRLRLAETLLKALANNPEERFTSTKELREHLQTILLAPEIVTVPPEQTQASSLLVNPWVNKLRSLYRNSLLGNENNRGLDNDFVRDTYVDTGLDSELLPLLFKVKPRVIFLSGNPGDGKTAFLERVRQHISQSGGKEVKSDKSGWEWHYQGHVYRSCYDASEANRGQSADEQLSQKLAGLEGEEQATIPLTVLVAINDGRLLDFFSRYRQRFGWLSRQLSVKGPELKDRPAWLIDLKKRAFVALPESDGLSIFQEILLSLLDIDNWQICQGCSAKAICPIRKNIQKLNKANTTHRLEQLFLLTHLRRQQHITMRDLRSAIAYIATGDLGCSDVHQIYQGGSNLSNLTRYDYWQLVFAPQESKRLDAIFNDFLTLDPGQFSNPRLDRFLHFHQEEEHKARRAQLFRDKTDLARRRFSNEQEWIAAFKRRLYFEAPNEIAHSLGLPHLRWEQLLPYKHAGTFFAALKGQADLEALKAQLAFGLLRSSSGVAGIATQGQLSITVEASEEHQLIVLKQFPLADFRLSVDHPQHSEVIEAIPEILILEHESRTPRMEITLDLFELLMRLATGLQPGAQEYVPLLEDLKIFKSTLLLQETRDLVLIENKQKVHYITQQNGKIVRSNVPLR